jgi:hypothetical protein
MDSILEAWFGKIKWPVVVLVVAIGLIIGGYNLVANINANNLRVQIVQACANSSNRVTCAQQLVSAVNGIHQ